MNQNGISPRLVDKDRDRSDAGSSDAKYGGRCQITAVRTLLAFRHSRRGFTRAPFRLWKEALRRIILICAFSRRGPLHPSSHEVSSTSHHPMLLARRRNGWPWLFRALTCSKITIGRRPLCFRCREVESESSASALANLNLPADAAPAIKEHGANLLTPC